MNSSSNSVTADTQRLMYGCIETLTKNMKELNDQNFELHKEARHLKAIIGDLDLKLDTLKDRNDTLEKDLISMKEFTDDQERELSLLRGHREELVERQGEAIQTLQRVIEALSR